LAPTREHLPPKSLKKKGQYIKQVLAHRRCNEMRGVMDADAFLRRERHEIQALATYIPPRHTHREAMIPANDNRRDDEAWAYAAGREGREELARVLRPFPAERMLRFLGPVDDEEDAA
jgi:hypothetical protein